VVGAASLTVLGSFVSDVTRLWPLYQGALFVLVVMYLPQGLAGLVAKHLGPDGRRELLRHAGPLALGIAGALLLGGATVFFAEYVSALVANPFALQSQGGAVSARLWGVSWRAYSPLTWALPAMVMACGALMLRLALRVVADRNAMDDRVETVNS
jgi:branched-chain amino acid transport system permease protein